jgi:competence protein ComEC
VWPIPFALGVALGAFLATGAVPSAGRAASGLASLPLAPLGVASLALAALAPLALLLVAWPRSPRRAVEVATAALLLAVGASLGLLRGAHAATAADPWAGDVGSEVVVAGRSDGVLLHVPGRGALLLRGEPVPEGRVELRGRIESLSGRRNPGGFDARAHWRRRGAWAGVRVEEVLLAPAGTSARSALRRGVVAGLSPAAAGLAQAMTLGIRDDLDELRGIFAASGLAHVLALSGLHVGVLAAAFGLLLRPFGRRALPLLPLAVGLYVALVGPSPSVVRAALMVAVVALVWGVRIGRPALAAPLALAGAGSLLVNPLWSRDLGFALSYASVAGILVVAPLLARGRRRGRPLARLGRAVAASLSVSVAAQVATASLVASHFGALPLLAPLANLVAVPLATLLVPAGFLAALAGLLGDAPARAVNLVTGALAEALIATARLASRGPALPWGEIAPSGHLLYAVAVVAVAATLHRRLPPVAAALVLAWAVALSAATPPPHPAPELVFLDVGQGDAVVLRLGQGQALLVDGGGRLFASGIDMGARVVVPALRALGIVALPVVVATHADLDHVHGLLAVLETFPVGELWIGHREDGRSLFDALVGVAMRQGVPVREVRRGESVAFGRVRLDVVHPTHDAWGEPNDDSVSLVLHVDGEPWALLAGDVTERVERDLPVPPLALLMTPHHGSATSTSEALLAATTPRLAVISVGTNRYGHPAHAVVERLESRGVEVRTTQAEGAIRLRPPRSSHDRRPRGRGRSVAPTRETSCRRLRENRVSAVW